MDYKEKHNRPVTIKDIALRAGVSHTTVSRVLNHPELISEKTRAKVLKCIKEMNYLPNPFARGLQTSSSKIIALVIPTISNLAFANFVHGVKKGLEGTKYSFILAITEEKYENEVAICKMLQERRVDGVIFSNTARNEPPLKMLPKKVAKVLVERVSTSDYIDSFLFDAEDGINKVCYYLHELGHKKIAIITGDKKSIKAKKWLEYFIKAMSSLGLSVPDEYIQKAGWTSKDGWKAMNTLLQLHTLPTAVFAITDTLAQGALSCAFQLGFKIPEDISIIGCNNEPGSEELIPPLTTLDASSFDMGRDVAEAIVSRIENPERPAKKVLYPLRLVVRSSTTHPKNHSLSKQP